jgi:hypothetical protein
LVTLRDRRPGAFRIAGISFRAGRARRVRACGVRDA